MSKPKLIVTPSERGKSSYSYNEHVASSWSSNLIEAGFNVMPFQLSPKEEGGVQVDGGIDGIVVPHRIFNTVSGYPMDPEASIAIKCGYEQRIPLFSEIPLLEHLEFSQGALRGYAMYDELKAIGKDLGETVIGQDLSVIYNELGVS